MDPAILRTIRPLFLDDLEGELAAANTLAKLETFHTKLADLTFFDPACGCGNFLVIAYREVRRLETETLRQITAKQAGRTVAGRRGTRRRAGQLVASLEFLCRVRVDQFYGIEIEEFPARIARTALYLIDHIANREVSAEFGEHYVRFPIPASPHVVIGNALRMDWSDVLPADMADYVFGNPPFVGIALRTAEQTTDLQEVWGAQYHGTLDLVTGWYRKVIDYVGDRGTRIAFVSTNSVCQGEQVEPLWSAVLEAGFKIEFAHRTFAWTSEARGRAHVHCVVVGLAQEDVTRRSRRLFDYPDLLGDGHERVVRNINPYLIDYSDLIVRPVTRPLARQLPEVRYGNKPTDDGNLIVDPDKYDEISADPVAARYLRPYVGARELLHGTERWCMWLLGAAPGDVDRSRILQHRVAAVRDFRARSAAASTRAAAATPGVFRQVTQSTTQYLCIPIHVSETRAFFPVAYFEPEVVASNATFVADDPSGFAFAVLSSSMFITWFRAVGGRIKSDLRFNKFGVYNTFPLPDLTDTQVRRVCAAGREVLGARAAHGAASLADLYDPLAMPRDLVAAHVSLDREVDRCFGTRRTFDGEVERLALLFERYEQLRAPSTTT